MISAFLQESHISLQTFSCLKVSHKGGYPHFPKSLWSQEEFQRLEAHKSLMSRVHKEHLIGR